MSHFENSTQATGSLLICAEGPHSRLWNYLLGLQQQTPSNGWKSLRDGCKGFDNRLPWLEKPRHYSCSLLTTSLSSTAVMAIHRQALHQHLADKIHTPRTKSIISLFRGFKWACDHCDGRVMTMGLHLSTKSHNI